MTTLVAVAFAVVITAAAATVVHLLVHRAAIRRIQSAAEDHPSPDLAERRLAHSLEVIPQGVVIADGDGHVVFHNQTGSLYSSARHGDALIESAIRQLVQRAIAGDTCVETVELFGPPRRTLVITAVPLDPDTVGPGAVAVIDDVTERRRLEAVRRDFVSNISHELKTPVGALALLSETLVEEDEPEVMSRLAERIYTEAHRVGRTIDDLLALSRIEAEENPHRATVPVAEVLQDAAMRMRPAADHEDITITVAPISAHLSVVGDSRQLASAVFNLLENAVKYSEPGSDVEVRAIASEASRVDISIRDQGMGIPARDLDRVFERFYRVDQARSRQTGGTGLGLAIVRHVANNHHGEVLVESVEGEGSTFTLRLPAGAGPMPIANSEAG